MSKRGTQNFSKESDASCNNDSKCDFMSKRGTQKFSKESNASCNNDTKCDFMSSLDNPTIAEAPVSAGVCELSTIIEENSLMEVSPETSNNSEIEAQIVIQKTEYESESETEKSLNENEIENDNEFSPGPLGNKFMDIQTTLNLFRAPHSALNEIPPSRKDGMYFIVDNSNNVEKRAAGTKSEFWDDCGAWKHASCPTALFIQKDDKLVSVIKRKGQYCLEKMVQRKRVLVYTPCELQPHSHDLLEVRRTYQTLKASDSQKNSFKRRISRFGNIPAGLSFIPSSFALVEYIGTFPPRRLHGNVKNPDANKLYIKTKPGCS